MENLQEYIDMDIRTKTEDFRARSIPYIVINYKDTSPSIHAFSDISITKEFMDVSLEGSFKPKATYEMIARRVIGLRLKNPLYPKGSPDTISIHIKDGEEDIEMSYYVEIMHQPIDFYNEIKEEYTYYFHILY
jgi:hypothetical protein